MVHEFVSGVGPHELVARALGGKLLVKGVLHPADAQEACSRGLGAVIVSNHEGRQLDGAPSPILALEAIREVLPPEFPVFIDGGFRRTGVAVPFLARNPKLPAQPIP